MCTSRVACNTQRLVSMGKIRKCRDNVGMNAIASYDKDVIEVTVLGDDETLEKLSRGVDEVEPYLDSRNTKGYGNHNSKSQRPSCVKIVIGGIGKM